MTTPQNGETWDELPRFVSLKALQLLTEKKHARSSPIPLHDITSLLTLCKNQRWHAKNDELRNFDSARFL